MMTPLKLPASLGLSTEERAGHLTVQIMLMCQEKKKMHEEFKASQQEMASKASRQDPYSFRRKGNQTQDRFCEDMEQQKETVSACISCMEKGAEKEGLAIPKDAVKQKIMEQCLAVSERSGRPQAVSVHTGHSSQMPQQRNTWEPPKDG